MHSHRIGIAALLATILTLWGCQAATTNVVVASLGTPATEQEMLAALKHPGTIVFKKHTAARWQVPLSGLLNLNHPKARAAGLEERQEPIDIYTYSLIHPTAGTFLVDSGVSERFRHFDQNEDISTLVNAVMGFDKLTVRTTTGDIAQTLQGVDGVFLTHIHMDHVLGLTDLETSVPVYIGPGDTTLTDILHAFTQGTTNRLLKQQSNLHELNFSDTSIIDLFDDGSLFALHAPGHTPGTTAYIANTTDGVQIMLGDVSHTRWGWENQVAPGTYSHDATGSAAALAKLKTLADAIQPAQIHPGHQALQ